MPKMWRIIQQQKFTLGSIMRARSEEKYCFMSVGNGMKKILFFENSLLLHKAIKLILENEKIYSIEVIAQEKKFENEFNKKNIDLYILNFEIFYPLMKKFNLNNKKIIFIYEDSDAIKSMEKSNNLHFIKKPFISSEFKNLVDRILQVDDVNENNSIHIDIKSTELENYMKELINQWIREQAPKYAKDIIREEINKLIS